MAPKCITMKEILADDGAALKFDGVSFEDGLRLLEELVEKVESGSLPLDKSIVSYEKGAMLIEHLRKQLSGAEAKLKVLQRGSSSAE